MYEHVCTCTCTCISNGLTFIVYFIKSDLNVVLVDAVTEQKDFLVAAAQRAVLAEATDAQRRRPRSFCNTISFSRSTVIISVRARCYGVPGGSGECGPDDTPSNGGPKPLVPRTG